MGRHFFPRLHVIDISDLCTTRLTDSQSTKAIENPRLPLDAGTPRNHSCSLAACTTSNENVCGAEAGNHKGCPYSGFAGTYFHTNRSCRFSPTSPIMKMGRGGSRTAPTGGYFQRNHSCSFAAAHRGMKMCAERRRATTRVAPTMGLQGLIFVPIVHVGCHRHHQS